MAGSKARLIALVGVGAAGLLFSVVPPLEGTILKTYRDPVGIITACTGHVDSTLRLGQTFTPDECQEMLAGDLLTAARGVQDCASEPLSDGEMTAYVSFAFNAGVQNFCHSTLVVKLNAGDHAGACAELSRWVRADGKVLPGLVKRRALERALCEGKS